MRLTIILFRLALKRTFASTGETMTFVRWCVKLMTKDSVLETTKSVNGSMTLVETHAPQRAPIPTQNHAPGRSWKVATSHAKKVSVLRLLLCYLCFAANRVKVVLTNFLKLITKVRFWKVLRNYKFLIYFSGIIKSLSNFRPSLGWCCWKMYQQSRLSTYSHHHPQTRQSDHRFFDHPQNNSHYHYYTSQDHDDRSLVRVCRSECKWKVLDESLLSCIVM